MRKLDNKKVKFIAIDRKYRAEAYPAVAPLDSKLNTYVTGQHIVPGDETTSGNLTLKEITGEMEIKPEGRRKKFPHVISDTDTVLIIHNKTYDCTINSKGVPVNSKDYAEAYFIINQTRLVAKSKQDATPKHKFYLEDKEADAAVFVNTSDKIYEAQKLIREKAAVTDYKDLILMLNLSVSGFHVSYQTMTDTRLKEVLLKQAEKDPDSITIAFTEKGKDMIFIAQLIDAKHITYKAGNGYYENQTFLANDLLGMLAYIADPNNGNSVSKWGRLLNIE